MTDEQHYQHLLEQLQGGQLALFIGADLPREITGLPSRADLARELARRHKLNESLPLAQVAQLVSPTGNRWSYTAFIKDALNTAGKKPQPFHQRIVELVQRYHIKSIITTAYDDLLEWALRGAGVGYTGVVDDNSLAFAGPGQLALIKLYGDAQRPESLVITHSDHLGLLNDPRRMTLVNKVKSILFDNTLLFLGYNLADPDFQFLFSQIAANRFARTAYAVWPGLAPVEVDMWRGQGIQILDASPLEILNALVQGMETPPMPPPPPSFPTSLPVISVPPGIALSPQERALLQHVHQGSSQVLVEREFGGGYSGTRVLLTLPSAADGTPAAGKVTKLGLALELRGERDNYQVVKGFLPFCVAPVAGYYEQDDRAALNYEWVGGGALGRAVSLEEYYRAKPVEQIVKTLSDLLDRELGQRWYRNAPPSRCLCAAEYGIHMVEHLRLELRPASSDGVWPMGRPPARVAGYRSVDLETIRQEREAIGPNTLASVEGLVVARIRPGQVKLQDPGGEGIVARVVFAPESNATQELQVGDRVGVRGRVVYNRRGRMEEIVRRAFPGLPLGNGEPVQLPQVTGTTLNPLTAYPDVLGKTLELGRSYVHGDLHLRNVLVDEAGKGWLIDLAKVGKGHRLYDFIKLETYIRLMELAHEDGVGPKRNAAFSLDEYVRFEAALNDVTLAKGGERPPDNEHLNKAYQVIRAIREMARKFMGPEPDFEKEYFPALFLYSLAVMKYYDEARPQPTRLAFATACALGRYLPGIDHLAYTPSPADKGQGQPSGPQPTLGIGNRWAVLVGVDEYDDHVNYGRLHVCVQDAHAIRDRLTASGFDPARIRLLADDAEDKPTRARLLAALQSVVNATQPDDLLLFYYSGHGDQAGGASYLVARDGQHLVLHDTAVPIARVKEIMEQAPARARVIILDACHSGADIGGKGPQPMSADFIRRVFEEAEGLAILASCKQGELSYEWQAQARSVFTHFMLEALQGQADRDAKGFVTVQDASRHVTDGVKLWASQHNATQTPTLQYTVAGDIILARYQ